MDLKKAYTNCSKICFTDYKSESENKKKLRTNTGLCY